MPFLYQGSEQLSQNKYSPTKAKHFESDKGITKQTPNKEKHPHSQNQTLDLIIMVASRSVKLSPIAAAVLVAKSSSCFAHLGKWALVRLNFPEAGTEISGRD